MKKQTLEQQARALDDPSRPVRAMSREIAPEIGSTPDSVKNYLRAMRNGYGSYHEMKLEERGCETAGQLARSFPHTIGMTLNAYRKGLKRQKLLAQPQQSL